MWSLMWTRRSREFGSFRMLISCGVSRDEGTSLLSLITTQLPLTLLSSGVYCRAIWCPMSF